MEAVFLKLLNMSITASWLALAVIVVRLLLKKAPKTISVLMWALVGIRLVCPFSFESILSLVPSAETVPQNIIQSEAPTIESGVPIINSAVNYIISENLTPQADASVNPMQIIAFVATVVWIVGVLAMIFYTVFSYLRIERKVREAVQFEGNVWLCDHVDTPFILGIVRPRIYLPSNISKQDMEYVIAHEKAHLKRRDHLWKPLGFMLLAVYWFNPVLWFAYILLCKDIELACDEKVLKEMGSDIKKPYSEALINCSVPRKMISACPLAFGEVGVKSRIKSVLNYKKPAFWIVIVAIVTSIAVAVCFMTNPIKKSNDDSLKNPPKLTVSCGQNSVNAWRGGYNWMYTNPHTGIGKGVWSDNFHPLKVLDSVPKLQIAPSRLASLQFSVSPDKIEVKCYKLDEQNLNNCESISVQGTSFKMKEGYHLYEIYAWWSSSDIYSGCVTYAFQTMDKDFVAPNNTANMSKEAAKFIGKTVGDVKAVFGDDFKFGYYRGASSIEYVDEKVCFVLDKEYAEVADTCKISHILSKGDIFLIDNLNCNLTYNDLVEQLGSSVITEKPKYWLDEMAGYYKYTLVFIYKDCKIRYTWLEDPNVSKAVMVEAITPQDQYIKR